mgnify:CR=1 FL=1
MLLQKYSIQDLEKKFKSEDNSKVKTRIQIILYLREGRSQREVSAELRISVGIVPYWKKRFEKGGFEELIDKKGRGRKSGLSRKDLSILSKKIDYGILLSDGYRRGYKTKDVKTLIQKEFRMFYSDRHIIRLLHSIKYNLKIPRPRNKSRNQNAVDEFKKEFKKNSKIWIRKH